MDQSLSLVAILCLLHLQSIMASPAPITGSCLCRALRYTVDLPSVAYPPTKHVCQCTMCRKHSGAILVPFIVLQQSHVYWGDPASKIVLKDLISANQSTYAEYESSLGRFRGFCSRCGSTMLWRSTLPPEGGESEDEFEILAGTIDEHILLGMLFKRN
ncbi:Mss4-like protein [Flagelloscypha sp. PMI_526]|nr:Mss4-like protein [Flagelloscypha sp. PMI_526]